MDSPTDVHNGNVSQFSSLGMILVANNYITHYVIFHYFRAFWYCKKMTLCYRSWLCVRLWLWLQWGIIFRCRYRASRIRNLGTHFFVHLITFLRTWPCTSNSHLCMLYTNLYLAMHLLQRGKYFRAEVNLRSIHLTINPEPSLGIQTVSYRERNNRHIFGHIIGQYFVLGL